jgi:ribosomal protein S18 acetylase RimI-like enzyme
VTAFAAYAPDAGGRPPAEISLRPATKGDVEAILRIEVVSGRAAGSVGSAEGYRRAIADADRCVLVAETTDPAGRTIVGWAKTHHLVESADPAPPGHYLAGITVDPAWRRRGVGAALTDARLQWIAGRATTASYVVNARNRASIELHRRWGFTEVLRAPRLMGVEFDGGMGLLMRLELDPAASRDPD